MVASALVTSEAANKASEAAGEAAQKAEEAVQKAAEFGKDAAKHAAEAARDAAQKAAAAARETAVKALDAVGEMARKAKDLINEQLEKPGPVAAFIVSSPSGAYPVHLRQVAEARGPVAMPPRSSVRLRSQFDIISRSLGQR